MSNRIDPVLKARRKALAATKTATDIGEWFRTLARELAPLPGRAEKAGPAVVRAFNLGHDQFRRRAPALASAPAAPPSASVDATLGVVLVRSIEIAHLLGNA